MALGQPSINTPNTLDLRALQTAVANTRSRIEQLEKLAGATGTTVPTTGATSLSNVFAQLSNLTTRLNSLEASLVPFFALLAQSPGLVVWTGSALITRLLEAGTGITITHPDGVSANPVISAVTTADFLITNLGEFLVTQDGDFLIA